MGVVAAVVELTVKMFEDPGLLTREDLLVAMDNLKKSALKVKRTPCILVNDGKGSNIFEEIMPSMTVHLKLENMQNTNSFKIRGVANQFCAHQVGTKVVPFVTMSAGNYGRAFAFASKKLGPQENFVLMPDSAPFHRQVWIEKRGVHVEKMPSSKLLEGVRRHEEERNAIFLHPFDDRHLIAGYGSLGYEICQQVPDVTIVLVCCGGGGLLAGVATALAHFSPSKVRVFGVEPENACGMYKSMKAGKAMACPEAKSIAGGLAPPFAGENAYRHVAKYVGDIILVTEEELVSTVNVAFNRGLVVEPSGAAALAALLTGKLETLIGPDNLLGQSVVAVITGSNVTPEELVSMKSNEDE